MSSWAGPGRSEKLVNSEITNTGCQVGMMAVWEFLPDASSPFPSVLTPSGPGAYYQPVREGYYVVEIVTHLEISPSISFC